MDEKKVTKDGWGKRIRGQFMTGLLVIVPVGASVLILIWIFTSIDNILQPIIRAIWGQNIPGVGFGASVVLIFLTGVVARNVVGKRIIKYGESLLSRVPIFKLLYRSIRQIVDSFSTPDKTGFMQVVLVQFPHKGMKAIGFITNEITDKDGKKSISVLIPNAPNPTSGFLEIVKEEDIIRTKITVDEAMKMVVSAGRMMPKEVQTKI
ncbi:MAG: hypothetical protein A2Y90_02030 [Chloroflexi bacterium RBG_13_52_12]|nr:MAG: hypothetical protein A2Y90_02030 [Chloroflexi bacterium RBG_13_52_12]